MDERTKADMRQAAMADLMNSLGVSVALAPGASAVEPTTMSGAELQPPVSAPPLSTHPVGLPHSKE